MMRRPADYPPDLWITTTIARMELVNWAAMRAYARAVRPALRRPLLPLVESLGLFGVVLASVASALFPFVWAIGRMVAR
jgi:hypothetical protein